MAYESFYQGTSYSMEPTYGNFVGYRIPAGRVGAPTSIQTADQIREVTNLISQGVRTVELQPISEGIFDQIPKQHLKEINRLSKLTGISTSVHAPVVEPSGLSKEGWNEESREEAERQLKAVVERSHELSPEGNIPITIHASAMPGTDWVPGKEGEERFKEQQIIAVNQDTGQISAVKREERYYPHELAGKKIDEVKPGVREPKEEIDVLNQSEWHQNLTQVLFYKNRGDEILEQYYPLVKNIWKDIATKRISPEQLPETQRAALSQVYNAYEYLQNSRLVLNSLYSKAYKYGTDDDRKILLQLANKFEDTIKKGGLDNQTTALQGLITGMQSVQPNLYKPLNEFAQEKSSETFANVAFSAYKKFGNKAPIISIENPPVGFSMSRAEELKGLIEGSRNKFVEKAKKEGHSEGEARKMAEKIIGATWDVGHINLLRKSGFKEEDIIKETEKIAEFVKHAHLTDNFGYSDSHLPPGMGNIPLKGMMEKLEKAGFSGRTIIEAGAFVQHFKTSPHPYALEAFGSPLYAMHAAPYWNQASGFQQGYFSGFGTYLPEQHFSIYGSGFSGLPAELGGQIAGKQSRMSGTPMD